MTATKIDTKYTTTEKTGAGRIVARGRIDGKDRQKSVAYDHSITAEQNHGRAAAALVRSTVSVEKWDKVAHSARHIDIVGGHRFTFDL